MESPEKICGIKKTLCKLQNYIDNIIIKKFDFYKKKNFIKFVCFKIEKLYLKIQIYRDFNILKFLIFQFFSILKNISQNVIVSTFNCIMTVSTKYFLNETYPLLLSTASQLILSKNDFDLS